MVNSTDQILNRRELSLNEEFQVLIALVCESIDLFKLYDPKILAVSISRSRSASKNGVWAYVAPLRHPGGAECRRGKRRGVSGSYFYLSPQIARRCPQARYLMTFLVPRFFFLSAFERLETIVHELYHLHPELKGNLRTFPGKHRHHGPTPYAYNRRVRALTTEALSKSPWLKMHPLLVGDAAFFKDRQDHHVPLPRQIFVPDAQQKNFFTGFRKWLEKQKSYLGALLVGGIILVSLIGNLFPVHAAVSTRKARLYSGASASATPVAEVGESESLIVMRSSASGRWLLVKNEAGKQGWFPAKWLKGIPQRFQKPSSGKLGPLRDQIRKSKNNGSGLDPSAADGGYGNESDGMGSGAGGTSQNAFAGVIEANSEEFTDAVRGQIADSDELKISDRKLDTFIAAKKGKFFETPSRFAARYGLIEVGDKLQILAQSKKRQWLKVRLLLTGEEGWYPRKWIKLQREDRLGRWGSKTLSMGIGYGSGGTNIGFGPEFFFNLQPEGFVGSPRDRLELGGFLDFFLGESLVTEEISISAKYLRLGPMIRYVAVTDTGFMGGAVEAGALLTQSLVFSSGVSNEVLAESGLSPSALSIGAVLGVSGFVAQSASFQYSGGVRFYLGPPSSFYVFLGPAFRF